MHSEKKTSQAEGTGSTRALRWEDTWFNPGAWKSIAADDMSDLPGNSSCWVPEGTKGLWLLI